MNFLGSVGGVGGGRGLLELSSRWWRGELGRGSRRLGWAGGGGGGCGGCPLPEPATPTPIPDASIALTLEELLNLLAAVFSFFLFCYRQKRKGGAWGSKKEQKREVSNKIIIKDKRKWRKKRENGGQAEP